MVVVVVVVVVIVVVVVVVVVGAGALRVSGSRRAIMSRSSSKWGLRVYRV